MAGVHGPATILPGGGGVLRFPERYNLIFFPQGSDPDHSPHDGRGDQRLSFQIYVLFRFADSHLSDAALALLFFRKAEEEVEPLPPLDAFATRFDWHKTARSRQTIVDQIRRMHARSFVSSLEMTLKVLEQIKSEASGYDLVDVIERQEDVASLKVPHLKNLRDSIQHADERVLGRQSKKKRVPAEISPAPLDTVEYKGAQIHVGTLTGELFRYTAWDGSQAEMTISASTYETLRRCTQAVVDESPWYRWPTAEDMFGPNPPSPNKPIPLNSSKTVDE